MYLCSIIIENYRASLSGYIDILLIPEGATNIVIREIQPSNNYLGKWDGINKFT